MSQRTKLMQLTPPADEACTFDVRSPADAREPLRVLREWTSTEPAFVLIARAPHGAPDLGELIDAMMPAGQVPTPIDALQARRNAEARWALLSEFGALTAAQVADGAGSRSTNRSALGGRWLRDGEVLAVTHGGTRYFPAFQFDVDGRPIPVIREVLRHLAGLGEWQRAIWFVTRSRLLDDRRPVEVLPEDPDRVLAAARASNEPLD